MNSALFRPLRELSGSTTEGWYADVGHYQIQATPVRLPLQRQEWVVRITDMRTGDLFRKFTASDEDWRARALELIPE